MKLLHSLTIAAVLAASAGIASATTITLDSYGTDGSAGGASNTALLFTGDTTGVTVPAAGTTYDIGTGGVWTAPETGSSWVSFDSESDPGGTYTAPNGEYTYTTTFTLTPGDSATGGTLTVLADDTTSVYLDGTEIIMAGSGEGTHCTVSTPNCITPDMITLTAEEVTLLNENSTNTLTFDVDQDYGSATGLDFSGSITEASPAPEPSSLVLLGTGLLAAAGIGRRRFKA